MKSLDFGLPVSTLFMLMSLDGKISTGAADKYDFDKDLPDLLGPDGLQQYYDLEAETDLWTLCSGRTLQKIYVQNPIYNGAQLPVTCVVVDSVHLTQECYRYLCLKFKRVIVASNNNRFMRWCDAPEVVVYMTGTFRELFNKLYGLGCTQLTIQSGGTLNSLLVREGLVNYVSVVVAPIIVGGTRTPSLVSGSDIVSLQEIRKLSMLSITPLKDSYVHLTYAVVNS